VQISLALRNVGAKNPPVAVVDHSARCGARGGEKVLPDGTVWMQSLVAALVDAALRCALLLECTRTNTRIARACAAFDAFAVRCRLSTATQVLMVP
jgi:hypothetical protein